MGKYRELVNLIYNDHDYSYTLLRFYNDGDYNYFMKLYRRKYPSYKLHEKFLYTLVRNFSDKKGKIEIMKRLMEEGEEDKNLFIEYGLEESITLACKGGSRSIELIKTMIDYGYPKPEIKGSGFCNEVREVLITY